MILRSDIKIALLTGALLGMIGYDAAATEEESTVAFSGAGSSESASVSADWKSLAERVKKTNFNNLKKGLAYALNSEQIRTAIYATVTNEVKTKRSRDLPLLAEQLEELKESVITRDNLKLKRIGDEEHYGNLRKYLRLYECDWNGCPWKTYVILKPKFFADEIRLTDWTRKIISAARSDFLADWQFTVHILLDAESIALVGSGGTVCDIISQLKQNERACKLAETLNNDDNEILKLIFSTDDMVDICASLFARIGDGSALIKYMKDLREKIMGGTEAEMAGADDDMIEEESYPESDDVREMPSHVQREAWWDDKNKVASKCIEYIRGLDNDQLTQASLSRAEELLVHRIREKSDPATALNWMKNEQKMDYDYAVLTLCCIMEWLSKAGLVTTDSYWSDMLRWLDRCSDGREEREALEAWADKPVAGALSSEEPVTGDKSTVEETRGDEDIS